MKALGLPVSEKKNFEVCLLCSYVQNCDPLGWASFDPNLVDVHKEILIKALSLPVSEKKNSEDGPLCSYVQNCDSQGRASFVPRGII